MKFVDLSVKLALKNEYIWQRDGANSGAWLLFLLPSMIIIPAFKIPNISHIYTSVAIYSFNLILNALLLLYNVCQHKKITTVKIWNVLYGIPISVTMFLMSYYLDLSFRRSFCHGVANALIFFEGVPFLLKVFPKSFTFGEANVVIQGISLFIYSTFLTLNHVILSDSSALLEVEIATVILQVGFTGILLLCFVPYVYKSFQTTAGFYVWTFTVIAFFIIPFLHFLLNLSPLLWIFLFLFETTQRMTILALWVVCTAVAVIAINYQVNTKEQATTAVRKYFHILSVVVFTTGTLYDYTLLYLASGIVLAIFIYLEVIRVLKVEPFQKYLNDGFAVYADEKDSRVALTPIYLMAGCSLPLWLHPTAHSNQYILPLLSGVLSIGIGDTAASVCGSLFGKHKWPGSKKTIEGTLACISSQLFTILILFYCNYITFSWDLFFRSTAAVVITSIVEANTDQVDNLALPLLMYILLVL